MSEKISVFGMENPLMDFIISAPDNFIEKLGAQKGTMQLVSLEEKNRIVSLISSYKNLPGGSCANTIRGIAWLARKQAADKTAYAGAVGNDKVGTSYITMMEKEYGILPLIARKEKSTGLSIVVVTPDFERTMFTYLGACEDFTESDIDLDALSHARIFYSTGYVWNTENQRTALQKAVDFCREKNIKIAFDLADPFVVKLYKDELKKWISEHVHILFGNRDEISMMTGQTGDNTAIALSASGLAGIVVMKAGADGCLVNQSGNIISIKGLKVKAVDTTGAGDSFAAGFLHSYIGNKDIGQCAEIANRIASGIVTVVGCDYSALRQQDIIG